MVDKYYRIIVDSKGAERNVKDFDGSMRTAGRGADQLSATVKKMAAAISAAISARQIVAYADAWEETQGKIRQVVKSEQDLIDVTEDLMRASNATRSSYESTVSLFTQLARSSDELGVSQERIIGVTKTVNNLFVASGADATSASNAIRQLSQGLAAGALRGDEFNSVAEQAPLIMRAISQETGKTVGELRDFAAEGMITSELLIRSLENYEQQAEDAAKAMGQTFGQSLVIARNNAIAFVGASEQITTAVGAAGQAVVMVSENIGILTDLVVAAAAVITARYVGAIGAWVAATIAATRAQLAAVPAVTGVNAALGVQSAAATKATLSLNMMAIAGRGASAALGLIGGPLGLAFIAGSAIAYLATNTREASAANEEMINTTDVLAASLDGMTKAAANAARVDVERAIEKETKALLGLRSEIEQLEFAQQQVRDGADEFFKFDESRLIKARAELESTGNAVKSLYERLETLDEISSGSAPERFDIKGDPFESSAASQEESGPQLRPIDTTLDIEAIKSETQLLENELLFRQQINAEHGSVLYNANAGHNEMALAQLSARIAEEEFRESQAHQQRLDRINFEREAVMANTLLTEEQKRGLTTELYDQEVALKELHEQRLIDVALHGKMARDELNKAEMKARLDNTKALGDSMMALGQGQSKKIFKIGQGLALAQASAALPSAVLQSFQNGGGYPWGLIPAGTMLATGLKNISDIKKAGSGLGGGGGGSTPNISLPSGPGGGSSIPSTAAQAAERTPQRRSVEVRLEPGLYTDTYVREIIQRVTQDDDNMNAIITAQDDVVRRGART